MTIIVTGGAGFISSNYTFYILDVNSVPRATLGDADIILDKNI